MEGIAALVLGVFGPALMCVLGPRLVIFVRTWMFDQ